MDKRIPALVTICALLLLAFGLGMGLFLEHTLQQTGQQLNAANQLRAHTRVAVRRATVELMERDHEVSSLLLAETPERVLAAKWRRLQQVSQEAGSQLAIVLAATRNPALRDKVQALQIHDYQITSRLAEDLFRIAPIDLAQARQLYEQDYLPAYQQGMALAAQAQALAIAEAEHQGSEAERNLNNTLALARVIVAVFSILGLLIVGYLVRTVTRLVGASERAAQANRNMMEHSLDAICTIDAEGRFLSLNRACETIWGYPPEELIGRRYIELVHPDDVAKTIDIAVELMTLGISKNFQNRYIRKDGAIVHVQWSSLWSASQRQIFAIARDITDLKRTEEALRASEERTRLIITNAHDAFIGMDAAGIITDWNPQAEATFGWTSREAIGQPFSALLVPPALRAEHIAGLRRCLGGGEWQMLRNRIECPLLHQDGLELPCEVTMSPIRIGGSVIFALFARDITARKQAEQELRQAKDAAEAASRAKSEFLANMSHEIRTPMNGVLGTIRLLLGSELTLEQRHLAGLARASGEALLTIINDILDFAKVEAGKLDMESLPFDLLQAVEEVTAMVALQAAEKAVEIIVRYPAGTPRLVIGDPGRIRQIINNLASNAVKFTEQGHVYLNVEAEARDTETVWLKVTVEDTGIGIDPDQLAHLFEKFTQADASTTRRYGGTGLGLAISQQLVRLMGGEIGAYSQDGRGSTFWFTLRLPLRQDTPACITGPGELAGLRVLVADSHPLVRRVLVEQLEDLGLQARECGTGEAALEVLHTGEAVGEPVQLALIGSRLPDMSGDALGRRIKVDPALRGTVLVSLTAFGQRGDTASLHGNTFAAYLVKPVRQSELPATLTRAWLARHRPAGLALAEPPPPGPAEASRQARFDALVLLVEDNTINRIVASKMLARLGCRVEVAANGREAVTMVDSGDYDLIFMDCEMPEMDGFEATAAIRQREDAKARLPIVAVTARALPSDQERCLACGMNDYITKPVQLDAFAGALRRWLPEREPAHIDWTPARSVR